MPGKHSLQLSPVGDGPAVCLYCNPVSATWCRGASFFPCQAVLAVFGSLKTAGGYFSSPPIDATTPIMELCFLALCFSPDFFHRRTPDKAPSIDITALTNPNQTHTQGATTTSVTVIICRLIHYVLLLLVSTLADPVGSSYDFHSSPLQTTPHNISQPPPPQLLPPSRTSSSTCNSHFRPRSPILSSHQEQYTRNL